MFTGALVSPARFAVMTNSEDDTTCTRCGCMAATWDHLAWECPHRGHRVPTPTCPIQRRLGWPTSGNHDYDDRVRQVAEALTRRSWDDRHGPQSLPDRSALSGRYTGPLTAGENRAHLD